MNVRAIPRPMSAFPTTLCLCLLLAQAPCQGGAPEPSAPPAGEAPARPQLSAPARTALAAAKEVADRVKDAEGDARSAALEAAAQAYDRVAEQFGAEAPAAAQAAYTAADLWRRHGSLGLAEQAYLAAARLDAPRYGQRATLAAGDMQRRLDRPEEALATYERAVAVDPRTSRAQRARLWRGRLLQQLERLPEAAAALRAALEAADGPRQVLEAADLLAKVMIAQGDLDGAAAVVDRAGRAVEAAVAADPEQSKLLEDYEELPARRALQRARDRRDGAAKDAQDLEQELRRGGQRRPMP